VLAALLLHNSDKWLYTLYWFHRHNVSTGEGRRQEFSGLSTKKENSVNKEVLRPIIVARRQEDEQRNTYNFSIRELRPPNVCAKYAITYYRPKKYSNTIRVWQLHISISCAMKYIFLTLTAKSCTCSRCLVRVVCAINSAPTLPMIGSTWNTECAC